MRHEADEMDYEDLGVRKQGYQGRRTERNGLLSVLQKAESRCNRL